MGFGRTGKFWGFQHHEGVVPDIVTSAKGLSGAYLSHVLFIELFSGVCWGERGLVSLYATILRQASRPNLRGLVLGCIEGEILS